MLTYICVIIIDFQAHRDAFIQNVLKYVPEVAYVIESGRNACQLRPEVAYFAGSGGNASELSS